jgi:hypothetical protein
MPRIAYIDKRLSANKLKVIATANAIITEYRQKGFVLTLRQLYYQFVARDLIANNQQEYAKLGGIINDGRMVGLIDWNDIIDRTRNVREVPHWSNPTQIVNAVATQFRIDKWSTQPYRIEVWIEKDALAGVVERVCTDLDIPYFSCRGYTSQSEMWVGAMRMKSYFKAGQTPMVLHFGDHDPSGKDMSRDILERIELFMGGIEFQRLALNWDQIEEYQPPPNPAKISDSRAKAYIAEFGDDSWELDALEPEVIVGLIQTTVESLRDEDRWVEKVAEEDVHRTLLRATSDRWQEVVDLLQS